MPFPLVASSIFVPFVKPLVYFTLSLRRDSAESSSLGCAKKFRNRKEG